MTRPELRALTARRFVRALEDDGFALRRSKGSHHYFQHRDGRVVVVALHSMGSTFKPGTLKAMLRAVRWTHDDLVRLELLDDAHGRRAA